MKTILFLIVVFLIVGTMDYHHEVEMDVLRKEVEAERQKQPQPRPAEVRHCLDGWVITYADAGPKLVRCV